MSVFEPRQNLIEVTAGLIGGQPAKPVVAAELDDDHLGMQHHYRMKTGDRILGGSSAGSLIIDCVVIAAGVEIPLQCVRVRLPSLQTVAGGDTVAEADNDRPVGGER